MKLTVVFVAIIVAQFCGTSLWFAGNALLPILTKEYHWPAYALGSLVSSTQLGFILGTLVFALTGVVDKYSPSKIFFISSILGSATNLIVLINLSSFDLVLVSRFLVGIFLSGIYPVGMKIAADWKKEGLGQWLGALVGALVIGTAIPHAIKLFPDFVLPKKFFLSISLLAIIGALLVILIVGDGPFRKPSVKFTFRNVGNLFKINSFRSSAFGYFGHMWELYAWWAFVPWIVNHFNEKQPLSYDPSLVSFLIIASGSIGCIVGGRFSLRSGSAKVATVALIASGVCCLLSPLAWNFPEWAFYAFMILWSIFVIADSPQFSTLIARNSPEHLRGSGITISTCIGFSITIISIQMLNYFQHHIPNDYIFWILFPGPVFGTFSMLRRNAHALTY